MQDYAMIGTQMVMVDSVEVELLENFVQLQIPGQLTTETTLTIVEEDVVCLGGCISKPGSNATDELSLTNSYIGGMCKIVFR